MFQARNKPIGLLACYVPAWPHRARPESPTSQAHILPELLACQSQVVGYC